MAEKKDFDHKAAHKYFSAHCFNKAWDLLAWNSWRQGCQRLRQLIDRTRLGGAEWEITGQHGNNQSQNHRQR